MQPYLEQAENLLQAHKTGAPEALQLIHAHHPRFLDDEIPWLPKPLSEAQIQAAPFTFEDAQLTIARKYNYLDWSALVTHQTNPAVQPFEAAVEAVITGDLTTLTNLLTANPNLTKARSSRVNNFDPPIHAATLLHYVAANGVENYRQKSPANAVEIAELLLTHGADPNALANMYGGKCTTVSMLVSSTPPAQAGTQIPLLKTLLAHGASVHPQGQGNWQSPLATALVFGFIEAAQVLIEHGAPIDDVSIAAALGRLEETRQLYPAATPESRHRALALAAQLGQTQVVEYLLKSGEDPNRYNPPAAHQHSTPLHQAALAGHIETVKVLVNNGARTDIEDKVYHGTPAGWADHGGHAELAAYLHAEQTSRKHAPIEL